jgi:hypothetical protein
MNRPRSSWLASLVMIAATVLLASCSAVGVAGGSAPPSASTAPATSTSPSTSPAASSSAAPAASSSAQTGIRGTATAGPVCPVERVPPDAGCAPRPVIGAVVDVRDANGKQVAQAHTGSDGTFLVAVPPGTYTVSAEETTGIMHAPAAQSVTVTDGVALVDLVYDTGIR